MISFENIHKPNWMYSALHPYIELMHNFVFYRNFYVLHKERIPKKAPVVAISNHQNGLSDALGVLFTFSKDGRAPVFIARADIFKKPIAARALRFLRIMPAFRAQDVGYANVKHNEEIFSQSAAILNDNGVVALFPEAGHQDRHFLGTFKKGFARMAFRAAEMRDFQSPVYVLPMSNHYTNYFSVQGQLVMTVGEPIDISYLYDTYKVDPPKALKELTERAREAVESLMLNIKTKEHYEEYEMLCEIYSRELLIKENVAYNYLPAKLDASKRIVARLEQFEQEDPEKHSKLMEETYQYIRATEKLNLRDWIFAKKLTIWSFLGNLLLCLLLAPIVIVGWLVYFIPFNAGFLITRRINDQMLHSSFHFAIWTLVTYPIWFIMLSLIIGFTTHLWWIVPILFVVCLLTVIYYFRGVTLIKKFVNRLRRFKFWFRGDYRYKRAVQRRADIVKMMQDLI
ncbi:MAG: 1-acyl-sn-glycerol-3-phosphate acyltransferase [Bacteroidales bacterium]|nr:1-acyl-sn-glycerol-3-phosphate acyltransferase [Bacteroidales bacterium]